MKLQLLSLKSLSSFIFLTKEVYSECTITVFSYSSLSFILYKVCDSRLIYIIELDKFLNKYIFFVPRKALKLHLLCVKQFDLLTWDCSGETPFFCAIYLFNVTQFGGISILSQYFHYFYLSQRITTLNWNFLQLTLPRQTTVLLLSDMKEDKQCLLFLLLQNASSVIYFGEISSLHEFSTI